MTRTTFLLPRAPRTARSPRAGLRQAVLAATLLTLAGGAMATEYGRVLSSTPVLASVPTSQQVCRDESRWSQPRSSGAGALVGALVGGVIGNAFGSGGGRALATGVGVMTGAIVGDRAEGQNGRGGVDTVRRCDEVGGVVGQVVGYDVVVDYHGQRRSLRVAQEPGDWLPLDVSVAPAGSWQAVPPASGYAPAPAYAPAPVYAPPPAYGPPSAYAPPPPAYGPSPAYAPVPPAYGSAPVYVQAPPAWGPPPRRWREPVVEVAPVVSIGYEWGGRRGR